MTDRKVLLIAYEFPPISDAGAFRPAAFAKYLPEFGFTPIVLTRKSTANRPVDVRQLERLPSCVRVEKIDFRWSEDWNEYVDQRLAWLRPVENLLKLERGTVAKGLAWRLWQRFPSLHLKKTWIEPAINTALAMARKERPIAIFATAPPFDSFLVGEAVSKKTGIPLILDFRDPFTYGQNWENISSKERPTIVQLERRVVAAAKNIVVVTRSMHDNMVARYEFARDRVVTITNGFDDPLIDRGNNHFYAPADNCMIIRHVGTLMRRRWPSVLFEALTRLQTSRPDIARQLRIEFVGACHPGIKAFNTLAESCGVTDLVHNRGPVSFDESQSLMREADMLLLLEYTERYALTGKLFEYIAARKPLLGMIWPDSDAADMFREGSLGLIVGTEDPLLICEGLIKVWTQWKTGQLASPNNGEWARQFHRRELTKQLASVLAAAAGIADDASTNACSPKTQLLEGAACQI